MTKAFVIYDTKYGNTRLAAENILEGIKQVGNSEASIAYVKETEAIEAAGYDVIVLGAPNHMGRPSRTMSSFVDKMAKLDLKAKQIAVFGTYAGKERTTDRAVKKLEHKVKEKLKNVKLISPGLSVRVNGIPGPVVEGELPKCVDFGIRIAEQMGK